MTFCSGDLDILARALDRALECVPANGDPERTRRLLMSGLIEAAEAGERREYALIASALGKLALTDGRAAVRAPQANL